MFPDSGGFEAQRRASGASDGRCDSPPPVEDLHQYAASVSRVPRYGAVRTLASANEEDQPGENEADEQESDEKEAKQEDWNMYVERARQDPLTDVMISGRSASSCDASAYD